jgi:hypothetical protein
MPAKRWAHGGEASTSTESTVAHESVVESSLLESIFRPFKRAFLYTNR